MEEAFPGRVLLGIGTGHTEAAQECSQPLATMGRLLDALAAAAVPVDRERMELAALGPKMLDLSAGRTLGAHPYCTPSAHTSFARERLGLGPLVAPGQPVVVSSGEQAVSAVQRHLKAGPDRMCVQAVGTTGVPQREWRELAAALIG